MKSVKALNKNNATHKLHWDGECYPEFNKYLTYNVHINMGSNQHTHTHTQDTHTHIVQTDRYETAGVYLTTFKLVPGTH